MFDANALLSWVRECPLWLALALLVAAHALDVLTTLCVLVLGGYEANPVARWAMDITQRHTGWHAAWGLVWLKALVTAALGWWYPDALVILIVAGITAVVAGWNICVAARQVHA